MLKSAYEDLVMTLISDRELVIEYDDNRGSFNPASFRSAYYRFAKSDIGQLMTMEYSFKMTLSEEPDDGSQELIKICTAQLLPARQLKFKVRSVPNA